ncbi:MAG: hypothetical protein AAGA99_22405 [Actinomycetota bacterium]
MAVTFDYEAIPYLQAHPPVRRQFYAPRRGGGRPKFAVVHTAENSPDTLGPDTSADAVARFIRGRSDAGSYHVLGDFDSLLRLGRDEWEMFGTGVPSRANRWSLHVSMACQAHHWAEIPADRRPWYGLNIAQVGAVWSARHQLEVRPITLAEAEDIVAGRSPRTGWCRHADLDGDRRSDPGWSDDEFEAWLATVNDLIHDTEETDMAVWFIEIDPQPSTPAGRRAGWVCREGRSIEPVNGAPAVSFVAGEIVHVREDTGQVLTTDGDYGMGEWARRQGLGHRPAGGAATLSDADVARIAAAVSERGPVSIKVSGTLTSG